MESAFRSRRRFLMGGAAVAVAGLLAGCSRIPTLEGGSAKMRRVGVLNVGLAPTQSSQWPSDEVWREQLAKLGWVEGQNLQIEYRHAHDVQDRLPDLAAELIQAGVEVISTANTPEAEAARQVTTTVPIIVRGSADPVLAGLVASLARPGGNVTGVSNFDIALNAKRIELLKECVPGLTRMAVLRDPRGRGSPLYEGHSEVIERTARSLDIDLVDANLTQGNQLQAAISGAVAQGADGLYVSSSPLLYSFQPQIARMAIDNGLPSVAPNVTYVRAGVLMSYAGNQLDLARRSAFMVDKILRGADPAVMPIEQPTKFDFGINLKTAETLGLTVPGLHLQQATDLIE